MTNSEFFVEILYIYNSVFSETRMIFSKIYKQKFVLWKQKIALYRIVNVSLLLSFHISPLQISHFDHRDYTSIIRSSVSRN